MIRFKDAEPAKTKEAARKPGKDRTDEAAAAETAPAPEFALNDRAKPAAAKRKKNFGG
jgi:hypothetical protein